MQEIADGITKTCMHEGQIIIYTVSHLGTTSLKEWSEDVVASLEGWPEASTPYLSVYDLSSEGIALPFLALTGYNIYNVGITIAGQKRIHSILQSRPALKVCLALVLSATLSGDIALRRGRQPENAPPQIEYKVYFDRPGAVAWLEKFIAT